MNGNNFQKSPVKREGCQEHLMGEEYDQAHYKHVLNVTMGKRNSTYPWENCLGIGGEKYLKDIEM